MLVAGRILGEERLQDAHRVLGLALVESNAGQGEACVEAVAVGARGRRGRSIAACAASPRSLAALA